jgi:hypothetical protein
LEGAILCEELKKISEEGKEDLQKYYEKYGTFEQKEKFRTAWIFLANEDKRLKIIA